MLKVVISAYRIVRARSYFPFSLAVFSKFFLDEHVMFCTLREKKQYKHFAVMKREPLQFQSPGQFNTPLSMLQMFSPRVTHAYEVAGENANKRSTHSEGEGWQ